MANLSKETLHNSIVECLKSDNTLWNYDESIEGDELIIIHISLFGILTYTGTLDMKGKIYVYDDGYFIKTYLGDTAAQSAIPELELFVETLNTYLSYGSVNVNADMKQVFFKTYEKFWDEHRFNSDTFFEALHEHVEAYKKYKESIYLLIKGASSASKQIEKILENREA